MRKILAWLVVLWFVLFLFPFSFGYDFFVNLVYDLIKIFGDIAKETMIIWATIVCITIGFGLLNSN